MSGKDKSVLRLERHCQVIPGMLKLIDEPTFVSKPVPGKWSKKEILGHLIDSTTNNHQRFVRIQFEDVPIIRYDQEKWVECSHYNQLDSRHLIELWRIYNLHLVELIKRIPEEKLSRKCNTGGAENFTLLYLIEDYVVHLEHHLHQLLPSLKL